MTFDIGDSVDYRQCHEREGSFVFDKAHDCGGDHNKRENDARSMRLKLRTK